MEEAAAKMVEQKQRNKKSRRIKGIMNRRGNRWGKQTDRETCRNIRRDWLIEQHKKTGGKKKHVHKDDLLILRVAVRNQGRMCKLSTCHKPESQSAFCNISSQQSTVTQQLPVVSGSQSETDHPKQNANIICTLTPLFTQKLLNKLHTFGRFFGPYLKFCVKHG